MINYKCKRRIVPSKSLDQGAKSKTSSNFNSIRSSIGTTADTPT